MNDAFVSTRTRESSVTGYRADNVGRGPEQAGYSCSTSVAARARPIRSGLMVRSAYNRIGSILRDTYGGVARAL